jgi:hypothetical protein
VNRKYALQRIKAGDYLLLSNDQSVTWRIATYTEDGSAVRDGGRPVVGTFWGLWKYTGRAGRMDVDDWNDFEMWDAMIRTRAEAIGYAMKDDQRRCANADH